MENELFFWCRAKSRANDARKSAGPSGVTDEQKSIIRQALAIGALVVLHGCDVPTLPTAPSELTTGIVVYEHADYLGASAHVTQDITHLGVFTGGPCSPLDNTRGEGNHWDDCISSVRVAAGWSATLYRDGDFKGDQLRVTEDIPNLTLSRGDCDKGGFNDCTTSIRVFRP